MPTPHRSVRDVVADFPDRVKAASRRGFSLASKLPESDRERLIREFVTQLQDGGVGIPIAPIARALGMPNSQAAELVTAMSLVSGLLGSEGYSAEDVLTGGESQLFDTSNATVARAIVVSILQHAGKSFQSDFERRTLATENLPSLTSFDVTVDLRLKIENEEVKDGVPVAIVHIDTDAANRELWLQLTRGDVKTLIDTLTDAQKRMEVAERFFRVPKGQ
jgi:hypothetical protein